MYLVTEMLLKYDEILCTQRLFWQFPHKWPHLTYMWQIHISTWLLGLAQELCHRLVIAIWRKVIPSNFLSQVYQLLHWMLLWTKLRESLVEEVLLSQLAGYDHQTLNSLILIVMISMCPQHLVYNTWQSQWMVVVPALWLLWLRTQVTCAWALPSPSPFLPGTGVGRIVLLLLHPIPSVSFGTFDKWNSQTQVTCLDCDWYS